LNISNDLNGLSKIGEKKISHPFLSFFVALCHQTSNFHQKSLILYWKSLMSDWESLTNYGERLTNHLQRLMNHWKCAMSHWEFLQRKGQRVARNI
jgi:hypothetical protein